FYLPYIRQSPFQRAPERRLRSPLQLNTNIGIVWEKTAFGLGTPYFIARRSLMPLISEVNRRIGNPAYPDPASVTP
ncbi:MAG: hypothetical protein IKM00_04660, partial [Clostridia bacterium]|nr:hypothetical protein [Clostridia bacterium]